MTSPTKKNPKPEVKVINLAEFAKNNEKKLKIGCTTSYIMSS
jgi:hypothetical protein